MKEIERTIIDFWADHAGFFGWSRTAALAVNLLQFREYLSVEEMSGELQISRSALSPALREAHLSGIVRSGHRPGGKKEYYELKVGLYHGMGWLKWRAQRRLIFIDPGIDLWRAALHQQFPAVITRRLEDILESFEEERELIRALSMLNDGQRWELLHHTVEEAKQMDAAA